jgi:hypothetical protein
MGIRSYIRDRKQVNASRAGSGSDREVLGKITGVKLGGFKNPKSETNEWSFSGAQYSNNQSNDLGGQHSSNWESRKPKNEMFATEDNDAYRPIAPGSKPLTKKNGE